MKTKLSFLLLFFPLLAFAQNPNVPYVTVVPWGTGTGSGGSNNFLSPLSVSGADVGIAAKSITETWLADGLVLTIPTLVDPLFSLSPSPATNTYFLLGIPDPTGGAVGMAGYGNINNLNATNAVIKTLTLDSPLVISNLIYVTPSTLPAALDIVTAGKTLIFLPGIYNTNNLLRVGVDYYMYPGVRIQYTQTETNGTDPGYGIFDDRYTGPTTNNIYGEADIYYSNFTTNGTQIAFDGNSALWLIQNTNTMGAINYTEAQSKFNIHLRSIEAGGYANSQVNEWPVPTGPRNVPLTMWNYTTTSNNVFECETIKDPNWADASIYDDVFGSEDDVTLITHRQGIQWSGRGAFFVKCKAFEGMSYGLNIFEDSGVYTNGERGLLYFEVDDMRAGINTSTSSTNFIEVYLKFGTSWSNDPKQDGSYPLEIGGNGLYYMIAQKIIATNNSPAIFLHGAAAATNLTLYLTVDTVESDLTWISVQGAGIVYAKVQKYIDTGAAKFEVVTLAGVPIDSPRLLVLDGGEIIKTGTNVAFNLGYLGYAKLKNVYMVNANTDGPLILANSPNLTIENGVFVTGFDETIYCATNQTVAQYGYTMANKGTNANITFSPEGIYKVDANVK